MTRKQTALPFACIVVQQSLLVSYMMSEHVLSAICDPENKHANSLLVQAHIRGREVEQRKLLVEHAFMCCWFGNAAFFALGNSHSPSTADLSTSYTGVRTYNQVPVPQRHSVNQSKRCGPCQAAVVFLTFTKIFAGPVMYMLALLKVAAENGAHGIGSYQEAARACFMPFLPWICQRFCCMTFFRCVLI